MDVFEWGVFSQRILVVLAMVCSMSINSAFVNAIGIGADSNSDNVNYSAGECTVAECC